MYAFPVPIELIRQASQIYISSKCDEIVVFISNVKDNCMQIPQYVNDFEVTMR